MPTSGAFFTGAENSLGVSLCGTVCLLSGLWCPHWEWSGNCVAFASGTNEAPHCEGQVQCTGVGLPVESTEGREAVKEKAGKDSAVAARGAGSSMMSCSSSSWTIEAGSETSVGPPGSLETSSCSIILSIVSTKWPCASPLCCGCCQPRRCLAPAP